MNNLSIEEIVNSCKGKLLCGDKYRQVERFSQDSRDIKDGDIYVGIRGDNFDGNAYYLDALNNGAIGCILEESFESKIDLEKVGNKGIILVKDSIKAIQDIATYRRNQFDIPTVAVTGSVGKTSTKDIIGNVLAQKFYVLKTQGNKNNHIGLPLTILELKNQNAMVVEMGMNHFGEIRTLTNIGKPTICVITNIGTSHIGNLGSRENILKAKLEILEGMKTNGTVIVNNDNDLLHKWAEENKQNYNIITYGIHNESDYMAFNIKEKDEEVEYDLNFKNEVYKVKVPVSGEVFVYNSLCAIAAGCACNIDIKDSIKGIASFKLTQKRMEIVKKDGITIINDSYNASYDSMKAGLEYLKNVSGERKIAVLGDMLELGEFSKELHEQVGEEVAKNNIDILITVGNYAKYIASKAKELGIKNVTSFENNKDASNYLKSILRQNDVILLKASNSMKFGEIFEAII